MEAVKEIFSRVFESDNRLFTKDLCPEQNAFKEKKLTFEGNVFREWDPFHSKFAAAIKNGLKEPIIKEKDKVLYLGSAEGRTVLHVSDIVGKEGFVFCVDISETAMQKLLDLSDSRGNIFPILADAQMPAEYTEEVGGEIDTIFQDVSQRNQTEIFLRNAFFLKSGGLGALSLKTKSISQIGSAEEILEKEKKKLEDEFDILEIILLEPFEKEHYLIVVRKK